MMDSVPNWEATPYTPFFLERVRKRLEAKDFVKTLVAKSGKRVRKQLKIKDRILPSLSHNGEK